MWLENQMPSEIVAADAIASAVKCQFYVPDNTADLLVPAWKRGELTKQVKRTEKVVRPTHLASEEVHYLYPLSNGDCPHLNVLTAAARGVTHLGWGIDLVIGDARVVSAVEAAALAGHQGHRWLPTPAGGVPLRVPIAGTLDDLMCKHEAFLNRLSGDEFRPVPPLKAFRVQHYRREDEPLHRPYAVFELRNDDDSRFRYPQEKLIHIAGMVRHLAIATMERSPPQGVGSDWIETYVAGHARPGAPEHRQFSYLPIPSIGQAHTNPAVRRVMIAAPIGDEQLLDYLVMLLNGQRLVPTSRTQLNDPPTLLRVRHDNVARFYLSPAQAWASVTPVILPGHDDHKPEKTRKLIEKALQQSGIDQPCEYEWSAFSRFPKSLSAHKYRRGKQPSVEGEGGVEVTNQVEHKYGRDKQPTGYIRPDHLLHQTAVHLYIRFQGPVKVPGPLVIGAGRHCGFGLMAGVDP
jgi:CRISPR-associated protein Csb2